MRRPQALLWWFARLALGAALALALGAALRRPQAVVQQWEDARGHLFVRERRPSPPSELPLSDPKALPLTLSVGER